MNNFYHKLVKEKFIFLILIALTVEYFILGKYSYVLIHDFADDIFPRYINLWRISKEYGYQGWLSDIGIGSERLSNLVYYDNLLSLFSGMLNPWLGYQLFILITTFIGGWSLYKMLVKYYECPKNIAILSSAIALLSIEVSNSTGFSAGLQIYPISFYLLIESSHSKNLINRCLYLFMALAIPYFTMSFTLGFIYLCPILIIFTLFNRDIRKNIILLISLIIIFAIFSMDRVASLTDLAVESHRSEFSTSKSNEGSHYFLTQLAFFLCASFFAILNKKYSIRILTLILVYLFMTIGDVITNEVWTRIFTGTPLISLKISRISFFSGVILCFMMAAVSHQLDKNKIKNVSICLGIILAITIFYQKYSHLEEWIKSGNYVANFESPQINQLKLISPNNFQRVAVIEGVTHPNMLTAYGLSSIAGYSPLYDIGFKHFWGVLLNPLKVKSPDMYEYFERWGSRFYLFTGRPVDKGRFKEINLNDFYNVELLTFLGAKYIVSHQPLSGMNLRTISLGVKAMELETIEKIKLRFYENLYGRQSLFLYENMDYKEMIWSSKNVLFFKNEQDLLAELSKTNIDELRSTTFSFEDIGSANFVAAKLSNFVSVNPSKFSFNYESTDKSIVSVGYGFSKGWTCKYKDGEDIKTFKSYGIFLSMYLNSGKSLVVCSFKNRNLYH